ncbi:MAG: MafI family immunity protein [Cyanobacteria bacterium P01_G01_bin.39]
MDIELNRELVAVAEYVQTLINLEYERIDSKAKLKGAFDQLGLRNGAEVVKDYLEHGEVGIAWEHLLYMVKETNVQLSEDYLKRLSSLAKTLNTKLH